MSILRLWLSSEVQSGCGSPLSRLAMLMQLRGLPVSSFFQILAALHACRNPSAMKQTASFKSHAAVTHTIIGHFDSRPHPLAHAHDCCHTMHTLAQVLSARSSAQQVQLSAELCNAHRLASCTGADRFSSATPSLWTSPMLAAAAATLQCTSWASLQQTGHR